MRSSTFPGWWTRIAMGLAALTLAMGAGACDDDDGSGGNDQTPATTPRAQITFGPPAIVEGNTYISTSRDYKIDFPEGWTPDENFIAEASFGVDAFFAPEEVDGVNPNINVRCDRDPEGAITQQSFVETSRQKIERFAYADVAESPTTLGGEEAVKFVYEQAAGAQRVKKTDIVNSSHGCAWTVTLTHAASDDNYAEMFDGILSTFAFIQDPASS